MAFGRAPLPLLITVRRACFVFHLLCMSEQFEVYGIQVKVWVGEKYNLLLPPPLAPPLPAQPMQVCLWRPWNLVHIYLSWLQINKCTVTMILVYAPMHKRNASDIIILKCSGGSSNLRRVACLQKCSMSVCKNWKWPHPPCQTQRYLCVAPPLKLFHCMRVTVNCSDGDQHWWD